MATVIAVGVLLAPTLARAASDITVVLTAQRVTVVNGKEALGSAVQARPGDVIEYRAEYRNTGEHSVKQLAATLPVPNGMEYLPRTAMPNVLFASTDGKNFAPVPLLRRVKLANGREVVREVAPADYRYLRWTIGTLATRESRTVAARVRVSPLALAAAVH
jgi:uncharacterized repeat protein (TIGR01451 family)